ncbi:L-galactono-1,4-lactone dehydrogenase 1 [Morus notabilis]|uniref:L-galactono-1,4-lactone dehydrogenase 1 n=1 Tax=Morus notabilis TaxID=981085 RepID=W9RBC0_9ROSA|nr:L-galactono-1,4-lactone dehydrogenase 1 [Morus notabilis]
MLRALPLKRSLHHHLKSLSSIFFFTSPISQNPLNATRAFSTSSSSSSSSSDAELRKYLGYTALLLFCGAATYYSFPFPDPLKPAFSF